MKIIGLTGSIGMGKSVTASIFADCSVAVFDSDACVHELLAGDAIPTIEVSFPEAIINGQIDRKKLGNIVFHEREAKEKLEHILHPMVWDKQAYFLATAQRAGRKVVVLDIPLLFETGRDEICDITVCVTAPAFIQRQRVMMRPNMTPEKFQSILKSQMPDIEKRRCADYVVQTGLGRFFVRQQVKMILNKLK